MKYNDEQILSVEDYEVMAKAYASTMKSKGFIFVQVDSSEVKALIEETFDYLAEIKNCLFIMGGFLNTASFYSLNERQIKKLRIIFDYSRPLQTFKLKHDKTLCFLRFLGLEAKLLKNLLSLAEKTNYETDLKKIVDDRLITLGNTFMIS